MAAAKTFTRAIEPRRIDLGFLPRLWQAMVLRSLLRFSVIVAHRQSGKTELVIAKLVDSALRSTRSLARFGYVAPLLKQAKAVAWDRLKAFARNVPGTAIHEGELSVELANGARVRLFGADNPDSLRGLTFDGLVLDEVAQMEPRLWGEVLLPTLADREGWMIAIGTPKGVNLFSQLYHRAVSDSNWYAARFDCYATDALTADAIEAIRRETTDAQFRQEMLCDFAAVSDNVLMPLDVAMDATRRVLEPRLYEFAPKIIGVDVAWQGGDASVAILRQGLKATLLAVGQGVPEKTFAARIGAEITRYQADAVHVDVTGGYGGEVVSRLRDIGHHVTEVVFSWKASDERFANLRAEMWFKTAEWLKSGASIPNLPELISQLCAPTYSNDNAANRLKIESKDDIRARLGSSTDYADALALTFAFPVLRRGAGNIGKAIMERDDQEDPWN